MHVSRGLLGWGVFFIALGAVPLAVQGGVLDADTARQAWQLWPLLLIGFGLGLALHRTRWAVVGNVVVGLSFGLIAGGAVGGGIGPSGPFALCGVTGGTTSSPNGQPVVGNLAAEASVQLAVDCGALTVSSAPGSGWSIAWPADGGHPPDLGPAGGGLLDAQFGQRHGFGVGGPAARWDVVLPEDPVLDVALDVGAGSVRADLAGAHLRSTSATVNAGDARLNVSGTLGLGSVRGDVNAGSMRVALPEPSGSLAGTFHVNVGTVSICTPTDAPLRITVDGQTLGSTNFAQRGLVKDGNVWTRGAWSTASSHIDLEVSVNLGSITLDPEDGCG
jgi:hypothetical protein